MKNIIAKNYICGLIQTIFVLVVLSVATQAATFTVTNTNDSGAGSLRQAILNANATAGADVINFNITTGLIHSIAPLTQLPAITDSVTINAATQPDYAGNPTVEIVGTNINGALPGLTISNGAVTVRALAIRAFEGVGIIVGCQNPNTCAANRPALTLLGSRIGTTINGATASPNNGGIYINANDAASSQIGGTGANDKNVISGNYGTGGYGIHVAASRDSSGNSEQLPGNSFLIINNMIGTNLAGTAALPNSGIYGHGIMITADRVQIGGDGAVERNVISGNEYEGIWIFRAAQTVVEGNYIGTNASGTAAIPNGDNGIKITGGSQNRIGGLLPGTGNVISGNGENGIKTTAYFYDLFLSSEFFPSHDNLIYGNKIGTNAGGTAAIPNASNGIALVGENDKVGLAGVASSANIIAGNAQSGIDVGDEMITGNFTSKLATTKGTKIQSNYIGTNASGTDLGNGGDGIFVAGKVEDVVIGGDSVAANVIAFNTAFGVQMYEVISNVPRAPLDIEITGNSIYSNDVSGIKLYNSDANGTDAGDADTGANYLQNMPVLSGAFAGALIGTFHGAPNTAVTLHFYSSPTCDASGRGEGKTYLNSSVVMTDANGNAYIETNFSGAVGTVITATATSPPTPSHLAGSTSEFSNCVTQQASPLSKIKFSSPTYTVGENGVTASIPVQRLFGNNTVTVSYATADGTATAGSDYATTVGTLTFNAGETTKNIVVPVTGDAFDETNETVNLTLSNPSFGAALISPSSAVLTITDDDTPPSVSISDVSLAEGNQGATIFNINVSLSAASGLPVSVNYATADVTANAGIDYQAANGTVNFAAGETSKQISVQVYGETLVEINETFNVNLSAPVSATIGDGNAVGTVLDDDNPGKFSFALAPYNTGENSGFATVTVTRTGGDAGTTTVDYATTYAGTATAGNDFTSISDTLVFLDGEVQKTFTVAVLEDQITEQTETINLILANPTGGATLGLAAAVINIIDNDSGTPLAIFGTITKSDNTPLANAQVHLQGVQTLSTTTDANGDYTFAGLTPNGNYTVTPVAFGYVFNPLNREYLNLPASVTNANFTATAVPTRTIRVVGSDTVAGQTAQATVEMVAQGDENSVALSLQFNPAILSNPQVALGADASGASLIVNDTQAATGKIGVVMAMPAGQTFAAGTKSLAVVTFNSAPTTDYGTPLDFTNLPTPREVANANADPLPTDYTNGAITFAQGWEGDVSPRPTGNGAVTAADFTQIGRFVAGLNNADQLNEFQRADVSPRISKGNGILSVSDYTQAGRYAAGLDPLQTAGGAAQASLLALPEAAVNRNEFVNSGLPRVLRVKNVAASPGQQVFVTIEIDANGDENGFGFTLNYDATKLSNPLVALGADTQGATLIPNTNTVGKVGVLLGLPAGTSLAAGTKQLVTIRFNVAQTAAAGLTPLTFGDAPVFREVVDADANPLITDFADGAVSVLGPTAGGVTVGGRVTNVSGRGINNVIVTLTASNGSTRTTRTNPFGYYRFVEVGAGEIYVLVVKSKRYQFNPSSRVLSVVEEITDADFTAEE